MKKLSELQEKMIKEWIKDANKNNLTIAQIADLNGRLSSLISNVENEKTISYFPRLKT